jgi:hypothetical protein
LAPVTRYFTSKGLLFRDALRGPGARAALKAG